MALPWLESIPVFGADVAPGAAEAPPRPRLPKRLAVLFMANGVNAHHWTATGAGADMQLGKSLEPMEPLKAKMNFITGLFNKAATGVGIHPGQTGNLLSGAHLQKGAELRGGISMDQVLANRIGRANRPAQHGARLRAAGHRLSRNQFLDGLQLAHLLAKLPPRPCRWRSILRWPSTASSTTAAASATRAFSIASGSRPRRLSQQVSSTDKAKLDEYLTSVREVEKRIETTREIRDKAEANAKDRGQPMVAHEAPRQRPARRHPRAHEADVRHRRAWVSRPTKPASPRCCCAAIFRGCAIRSSTCACRTTPRRTRTSPTPTNGSADYYVSQFAYLAGQARCDEGRRRHGAG